ncbi:hypothetical protein AALP_AA4G246700 [Arabis alpina]|uniref:C3H1-type domain-containing protein n=1 Tax=Arabis alpina TaxID=50452 RepID=A0A087H5G0_ARAAL|nr:hypothetical protein AALP_AA4G246700 [Arabis alpina]
MNHKAPRRYSQGRDFGVDREQDFAADIVPRRSSVPYENRLKKCPYKGSRNLVWTSKEFQASEGDRPRKNDAYRSMNSSVPGTGYRVSNQPTRKNVVYGSRSSRVWRSGDNGSPKSREKCVCKYWIAGNCKKGEQCQFLHSWCCFPGLVMVATLEGHKKDIKGIALPEGSDKLYSASNDGALKIWDCHTGQCVHEINLQAEAGSLTSEGPWVFLGLPNAVKAFNVQTCKDLHLNGPVGQVNAIAVGNGMLFAGTSSGSISVWKATDTETDPFEHLTSLEGHSGEVKCLIIGGQTLYSGSVDRTIKVWVLKTLQCLTTLRQHSDTVTSLLCWDQYLLSSSLDGTIKVWGSLESGNLKVIYTRREEQQSVHALCGLNDAEAKPIIFCSYQNGTVGIYDLPSFEERGKMFSTHTIETLTIGPDGLLFSGDKSGKLRVWNLRGSKV